MLRAYMIDRPAQRVISMRPETGDPETRGDPCKPGKKAWTMMKRPLPYLLALMLLFCRAASAEQAPDPVVVRVGAVEYRQSEVQAYWDSLAEYALAAGEDASVLKGYAANVVESYIGMGVLENKIREFGLDVMTPGDNERLDADALERYDRVLEVYTQSIMSQYQRTHEEAEPYARNFMELDGYTMAAARDEAFRALKEERILEYVAGDVAPLTEDELADYYEQNLVAPCRVAYANNYKAFEKDVLVYGGISYYIPDGYRYVRHIFFKADDATRAEAAELEKQLITARADMETAKNKLFAARLLAENENAAEKALLEAEALCADLEARCNAIYAETMTKYAGQIEQVQARLAAGEDFVTLMNEYSQDDLMTEEGFMISNESVLNEEAFQKAAMALTAEGEVSLPVIAPSGVHILQYVCDAPSGAVPLEGELKDVVAKAALMERKYSVLSGFLLRWRDEYEIQTHPALLSTPECLLAQE